MTHPIVKLKEGFPYYYTEAKFEKSLGEIEALLIKFKCSRIATSQDHRGAVPLKTPHGDWKMRKRDLIDRTLINTGDLLKRDILPAQWVPVLQGRTRPDYRYSIEAFRVAGLWRPLVAVGSLVGRKRMDEVLTILQAVRRAHPQVGIHAFGLGMRAIQHREIWDLLTSVDTPLMAIPGQFHQVI